MTLNISLNGDVTLDESAGLQVGGVGTPTEDNDDDDVTLATLQSDAPAFYNRLFSGGQLNLSTTFPTLIGVAESQDDLISVSSDTPLIGISFSFTEGGPTGLSTLAGNQIFYYADPTDSNILLLREGSGATPDQNGDIVAALYLDIDTTSLTTADVKLWIVQFESLLNTNTSDHDDALQLQNLSIGASAELSFDFDEVKSGNFYFIMYGETDGAVLVSSSDPDNLPTNTSQGGLGATVGVASQMTGAGEALVFTYIDQVPTDDLLNNPANPNLWKSESNIDYGGLINGAGGSVTVSQTQGSGQASLTLEAYSTALETGSTNPDYSDGLISNDTSVTITSVQIVETIPGDFTASAQFSGGTWTVTGLEAGDVIKYTTDGLHNRLVVAHADVQDANANFDIGAVSILQSTTTTLALNNIFFEDDGPSLTLSIKQGAEVRLDETDNDADDGDVGGFLANVTVTGAVLFSSTPAFGTDGAGSTNYSLSISSEGVDSGLIDAQTDQAVLLYTDGSDIVGRINVMGSDFEVLRISINSSSGDTTVKQSRAVEHDDTSDPDESTSPEILDPNVLFVNRTILDADGDSATQQVDLGPIIKIEDSGPTMTSAQNLVVDNVLNDMETGVLGFDTGSDIDGIFAITDATKTASLDWSFADVDGDTKVGNNEIVGTLDGDDLYSLIINDDGSYKFTLLAELESEVVMLDVEDIKAGGPDTNFIDVGAIGSSAFVRITGIGGAINESNKNVGVKNGNLDANEGLVFEYFENNMVEPISSLSIGTKTAQTVTYSFEAEFEGQVVFSGTQVVEKNGTLLIEGMNDQLFDKVTIENLDGNAVKIGLEDIKIEIPPNDVVLAFDVSHTDSDGDSTTLAAADLDGDSDNDTFKVSIDADGDNMIT